jgi:hypothetical protein
MNRSRFSTTVIALLLATVVLTGCASAKVKVANHDPRRGLVIVDNKTTKRCDGTTLIYNLYGGSGGMFGGSNNNGLAVIPNSPECVPSK